MMFSKCMYKTKRELWKFEFQGTSIYSSKFQLIVSVPLNTGPVWQYAQFF